MLIIRLAKIKSLHSSNYSRGNIETLNVVDNLARGHCDQEND